MALDRLTYTVSPAANDSVGVIVTVWLAFENTNDPLLVPLTRPKMRKVDDVTVPVLTARSKVTATLAPTAAVALLTGLVDTTCICAEAAPAHHTNATTTSVFLPIEPPEFVRN